MIVYGLRFEEKLPLSPAPPRLPFDLGGGWRVEPATADEFDLVALALAGDGMTLTALASVSRGEVLADMVATSAGWEVVLGPEFRTN